MSGPPNLSDRPLGKSATLEQVIWFLDRQLVPFVRYLKRIFPSWITPGDDGDVLQTVDGEASWGPVTNDNVANNADIEVSKLDADGNDGDVLTIVGGVPEFAPPAGGVTPGAPGEVLTTIAGPVTDWAFIVNANVDAAAAVAVSKLAAGTNGDVLTTVAGVPTWQAASAGGFWEERLSIDCAGAPTTAFPTSLTPVTFEGYDWTPRYVSATGGDSDNGNIDNVNGTGLQIVCNGNASSIDGSTAPRLLLDLRELGPLSSLGEGAFRVRVQFSISPLASDFQFFHVGLALIQQEAIRVAASVGYNAGDGGAVTTGIIQHGGVSANYFMNPEALGSNDVLEFRFYHPFSFDARFGEYSGDWPVLDSPQNFIGSEPINGALTVDSYVQQRDSTLGAGAGNRGLQLFLAGATNNPGVGFTITITQIVIDQWRNGS